MNFAAPMGITPMGYFILAHLDGAHSFLDIQEAYSKRFGTLLISDELRSFVEMLDEHYFLDSERFQVYQKSVVDEFRRLPHRAPAHMGGVYKEDPLELKAQLDGYFTAPNGPGFPSGTAAGTTPKAIVAPHIDFHRGGSAYAWAYKPLVESDGADLYVLLGTSHVSGETPFVLTTKDFITPLGTVETDKDFVARVQEKCAEDLFADEYLHRSEHSLEFQVLFLKYCAKRRAELTGRNEKPFKIVPILVTSFHSMVINRTPPEEVSSVEAFLRALRELTEKESRRICFVAGVDLAHVGRQFGDPEPVTDDFLTWVENEDRELVARLAARDAPGFFNEITKNQDRRRICGFSPLYSLIHLLDGYRGKLLRYGQAVTRETGSAVTFASAIFE
jgi:hypothetical protein